MGVDIKPVSDRRTHNFKKVAAMNNDKYFTGKLLVGGALGLGLAALLISAGETSRRHEAAGRAIVGNDRGHYGRWRSY